MIKSIAIITLYDNINIGNKLQNYAVQELMKKYADNVTTFTYSEAAELAPDMGWKGRIAACIGFPKKPAQKKRAIIKRRHNFERFSNTYLNISPPKKFADYFFMDTAQYDAYIAGSDQVWHNWSNTEKEMEYFFLKFVPESKRYCISPSFGFEEIPKEMRKYYKTGLEGFRYLSCREKDGCDLIKKLTGKEAECLIDPTLMFTPQQWNAISRKPYYEIPDKYMLVYFLGEKSGTAIQEIEKIANEKKLEIVDIFSLDQLDYYVTAPDEFLYLVSHADFVCTNSFHASVFSILYKKQFMHFKRIDSAGAMMSGRNKTLYSKLNITFNEEICDYYGTDKALEEERQKMFLYLEKIFSG